MKAPRTYPPDWNALALACKNRAGWMCEVCGRQCRRPGESLIASPRTLTVTQRIQSGDDFSGANLIALCPNCRHKQETTQQFQQISKKRKSIQGG
jgi:rubrerythrin